VRRALLVIDVQNEYVSGALPISYPPVEHSLERIGRALDVAESADIPVIVVQQTAPESSPIFAAGSHGAELHRTVATKRRDLLLSKTLPSCFADTDLDQWLRENGIDTVAIAGYMTQNCDESTARDAAHRGYRVEFLSDATGTLSMSNEAGTIGARELHEAVTIVLQSRFPAVITTEQWCEAVATGVSLTGSNVFASTAVARG
jgi:nicotinamidase-related amidase